jgi:hypothetical protein
MTSAPSLGKTPSPPYYAVIFTSQRTEGDRGYGHMADRMVELASKQPGLPIRTCFIAPSNAASEPDPVHTLKKRLELG